MSIRPVKEHPYGIYVWKMPDGSLVSDDQGNRMMIAAEEGDLKRVRALQDAARSYGIEEGAPMFIPHVRPVDDEEYERQKARLALGLIPDEYDIGAWMQEEKLRRENHDR